MPSAAAQNTLASKVSGELKTWHGIVLDIQGPQAREEDDSPNPFTDYSMSVLFQHESGSPRYKVPGYFAADGNAAATGASSGRVWRAHLVPSKTGKWSWTVRFRAGPGVAVSDAPGKPMPTYDGQSGSFQVGATDKSGRDFRGKGQLRYVGKHHLRFAETGEYFLKAGPDAPETLLAYVDFDNTKTYNPKGAPLKTWEAHRRDWRQGDPSWRDGRGKGLIGAINYLAEEGLNTVSFLPYNAGGDGNNVWPFVQREDSLHYDVSKLEQWGIVFSHAQRRGVKLHFKLQETENDDQRKGRARTPFGMPYALDGGATGPQRKLYLRELIARFGHHLALTWNLGEESTMTTEEQRAMAQYIRDNDPYGHPIVLHTYPDEQEEVYKPHLGKASVLTGLSLQNRWDRTHERTQHWVENSAAAGKAWVVANDEQGPAKLGAPPDPGYENFDGTAVDSDSGSKYDLHGVRSYTLWGNLMAGGAGVEYYFGYRLPQNDLRAEDFRSRDLSWDYCRHALEFFRREEIPFWEMTNVDALVGNPRHENSVYALAQQGELYLVYLPQGGRAQLDLRGAPGDFDLAWFNPRVGGPMAYRSRVAGGGMLALKAPPAGARFRDAGSGQDWLAVLRRPVPGGPLR